MTLHELSAALAVATVGSPELDLAIADKCCPDVICLRFDSIAGRNVRFVHWKFTTDISASVAFVERVFMECAWVVGNCYQGTQEPLATLYPRGINDDDCAYGDGKTPALALCLAAINALIAQETHHD